MKEIVITYPDNDCRYQFTVALIIDGDCAEAETADTIDEAFDLARCLVWKAFAYR